MVAKVKYGAASQNCSVTLAGNLVNGSLVTSELIENSLSHIDVYVFFHFRMAGSASSAAVLNVYAYGSVGGGIFTDDLAASVSYTSGVLESARLIASVDVSSSGSAKYGPVAVAPAFGGVMPFQWGVIVDNQTGVSMHTTAEQIVTYQGVNYEDV